MAPVHMLCRNRVADFERWKRVFESHTEAHRGAGLELLALWRKQDEPNEVFFLFSVESVERARAFVEAPQAADAGEEAGVLEGEIHFLEPLVDRR